MNVERNEAIAQMKTIMRRFDWTHVLDECLRYEEIRAKVEPVVDKETISACRDLIVDKLGGDSNVKPKLEQNGRRFTTIGMESPSQRGAWSRQMRLQRLSACFRF